MPYRVVLESGENLIFQAAIDEAQLGEPFLVALSDKALFFPKKRWFAVSDPYSTVRIDLSELREVAVRGSRSLALPLLGILFVGFGAAIVIESQFFSHDVIVGLRASVLGTAIVYGALGRQRLVASTVSAKLVWRRPMRAKPAGRKQLSNTLGQLLEACRRAGAYVPS